MAANILRDDGLAAASRVGPGIGAERIMTVRAATGVGLIAVLLWSALAPLTVLAGAIPPFQLVAMSFSLGALIGLGYLAASPSARRDLGLVTLPAAALGIGGLLGFHFFSFLSLSLAPPLEANLVNYLWPLLIVLFSALLPASEHFPESEPRSASIEAEEGLGGGLRWHHLVGALLAFAGAVLAITKGTAFPSLSRPALAGYGVALLSALTWAAYSVLSRLFASVPSSAVALYCAATALGGVLAHLALERTAWPLTATQWLACAGLGLGPVGLAFYVWDYGCKHGDLRVLGASAYFAPLLSTLLLILFGLADASPVLWLATLAITGGALLASKDMLRARRAASVAGAEVSGMS
jgi:drug/metabolite transporter (DMT)-like permease